MKTEFRLSPHTVLDAHDVVEIWHDGRFIGEITGADGPGVRVISKHDLSARGPVSPRQPISLVEVLIDKES